MLVILVLAVSLIVISTIFSKLFKQMTLVEQRLEIAKRPVELFDWSDDRYIQDAR